MTGTLSVLELILLKRWLRCPRFHGLHLLTPISSHGLIAYSSWVEYLLGGQQKACLSVVLALDAQSGLARQFVPFCFNDTAEHAGDIQPVWA